MSLLGPFSFYPKVHRGVPRSAVTRCYVRHLVDEPKVRSGHCPSREVTRGDHEPAAVAPAVARDPPRGISRPRDALCEIAGTCRSSRDGRAACLKISREPSRLRTVRRGRSSPSALPFALLTFPLASALNRLAGTGFVDTGCLKSRGIGTRQAFIDKGTGKMNVPIQDCDQNCREVVERLRSWPEKTACTT
jgi:hypothetical protein